MSISKRLVTRSESIESIFNFYIKRQLLVNRLYQRKLVWTIEEKESFIDSISRNYPVPLFLVAEINYQAETRLEIIDGMQRLNAIVSFIEGEFSLDGKYFDLATIAVAKQLLDDDVISQKTPRLDRDICRDIVGYTIPLSVSSFGENEVEDIFKRINSSGRHLSKQELRQAGSNGKFAKLVRKIAESIRGDESHSDRLYLNSMKEISINSRDLSYGINMGGIFWRKHNIVTKENIRGSRDEELIAHILTAILIAPAPSATSRNLDGYYGLTESRSTKLIEDKIDKLGEEFIKAQFEAVFTEIKKTLDSSNLSFHQLLFKKDTTYASRSFQVIFLTFHDLLINKQKKIIAYDKLAEGLQGLGDSVLTNKSEVLNLSKYRSKAIDYVRGSVDKYFEQRGETDPALSNGIMRLESLLSRSKTENTNYDFKIGFHRLYDKGEFDENCFKKVIRTLTAIVNKGKGSVGYVIMGVADTLADANKFTVFYPGSDYKRYKDFYICGVDQEGLQYKNIEEYRTKISQKIDKLDIQPEQYKRQILRNMDMFNYGGRSVILFRIEALDDPAEFEGAFYERQDTSTKIVPSEGKKYVYKRFL